MHCLLKKELAGSYIYIYYIYIGTGYFTLFPNNVDAYFNKCRYCSVLSSQYSVRKPLTALSMPTAKCPP